MPMSKLSLSSLLSVGARKNTQAKTYGKCEIGSSDNVKLVSIL